MINVETNALSGVGMDAREDNANSKNKMVRVMRRY